MITDKFKWTLKKSAYYGRKDVPEGLLGLLWVSEISNDYGGAYELYAHGFSEASQLEVSLPEELICI